MLGKGLLSKKLKFAFVARSNLVEFLVRVAFFDAMDIVLKHWVLMLACAIKLCRIRLATSFAVNASVATFFEGSVAYPRLVHPCSQVRRVSLDFSML